jgi:hypothetical protein
MSVPQKITQPKPIRVAPIVSDPVMRNSKGPAEMLLNDELGVDSDIKDAVFSSTAKKTKEETDGAGNHDHTTSQPETNTMVLIAFALIVIALVAIIVWMVMRNSGDKKEEEEVRRMIRPHPRNGMPPNGVGGQYNGQYSQQPHRPQPDGMTPQQMEQMYRQQQQMQQQMAQMNRQMGGNEDDTAATEESSREANEGSTLSEETVDDTSQPTSHMLSSSKPAVTRVNISQRNPAGFADAMANLDSTKVAPNKEVPKSTFTKSKPHPSIIRPSVATTSSDVDDVMAKTAAMLKAGASKSTEDSGMSEIDRALLDRVNSNTELDEENDE